MKGIIPNTGRGSSARLYPAMICFLPRLQQERDPHACERQGHPREAGTRSSAVCRLGRLADMKGWKPSPIAPEGKEEAEGA
jgi:hypothetical protein